MILTDKNRIFEVMQKMSDRQSAIDLEKQLAEIRAQSHALKWTGPVDELTATITRWFESGWIVAESLQDALQRASIHFADAKGIPVIQRLAQHPESEEAAGSNLRQTFVKPILDQKGWSILDWATEANVSPATTQDYLANKTKPYASTRLKLAEALGVSVQQLPR